MPINHNSLSERQLAALHMTRCPFNRFHVVKRSGFQKHLIRCQRNMNSNDRNEWKSCPFNADHWLKVELFESHLLECPDNRQLILDFEIKRNQLLNRLNAQKLNRIGENVPKDDIQIKEEFVVKQENRFKEPNDKIAVKVVEMDEWLEPETEESRPKFMSIYEQKPKVEDLLKEEHYIEPSMLSGLSRAERKQFYRKKCEMIRQKPESRRDPHSRYIWGHFKPSPRVEVREKDRFVNILELKPFLEGVTTRADLNDIISVAFIKRRLHSVDQPLNSNHLDKMEANAKAKTRTEPPLDSVISRCFQSIDLSEKDLIELNVLVDKPMRKPNSSPFDGGLRRPVSKTCVKPENNTK